MSRVTPQSSTQRVRPLSPFEHRLSDIADTWFPESFSEGAFDSRRLYDIAAASGDTSTDFCGLLWPGKFDAMRLLAKPANGALLFDEERSLNPKAASHAFCVGDNLEVLKLLQPAYFGKCKMAFLEPPYNVGGDFIYPDGACGGTANYLGLLDADARVLRQQKTAAATHSNWLSMMLPRLFVVRNLLRDDGVCFVVVDDHEVHSLRLLMNEVFGESNFVCTFIWEKKYSPAPDAPDVGYVHENILCYRKTDDFAMAMLPHTEIQRARYKNPDNDPRGVWKTGDYTCRWTKAQRPTLYYAIRNPHTGKKVWPKTTRVWSCSEATHKQRERDNLIWWPPDAEVPALKKFLSEVEGAKPSTLLSHRVAGHTDEATTELREQIPDVAVTPKPVRLIQHLFHLAGLETGDIVLDPFARVGTVAAAAARTLANGGVDVKVVSVELPLEIQSSIAPDLASIGIRRAVETLRQGSTQSGIRVYELRSSGIAEWAASSEASDEELVGALDAAVNQVDPSRSQAELVAEVALQCGCPLDELPLKDDERVCVSEPADAAISLVEKLQMRDVEKLCGAAASTIVVRDDAFPSDEKRLAWLGQLKKAGKTVRFL